MLGGIHATHCIIDPRLAGDSAGHVGYCITFITHYAICAAGCLVFCPIIAAFSSLAAVALAVWPLYSALAATSRYATRRKISGYLSDNNHLCYFYRLSAYPLGAHNAVGDVRPVDGIYVAHSCGGRNNRRAPAAAIKLHLSDHLLRFGRLRAWLPLVKTLPLNLLSGIGAIEVARNRIFYQA